MATVAFWLRTDIEGVPRTLIRRYVDDQGRVRLERRNRSNPEWVETAEISYTGLGGDADWDLVTPERAAEVLTEWAGSPDPLEGLG